MKTLVHVPSDTAYYNLERVVSARVASLKGPVFTTDSISLFEMYLNGIPLEQRQHYNCQSCRRFVERYGGLVTIDKLGCTAPAIWRELEDFPSFFRVSVETMREAVAKHAVTGVFLNQDEVWGQPKTGEWTHMSGTPSLPVVGTKLKNADQLMAEKLEDRRVLARSVGELGYELVCQAVRILEADALDRSEKTLGVARWFKELHERIAVNKDRRVRDALIWLAVAEHPSSLTHVRSSMIGTLLQDIKDGLSFEDISARWSKKMHPLQYRRPTAPVSDGQIEAANKVVEKLGIESALKRRFAKLEDCLTFWRPTEVIPLAQPVGGAFDHLRAKAQQDAFGRAYGQIDLPIKKVTWEKFRVEHLPKASRLEFLVPGNRTSFYGLVTACDPSAPPILQWDFDDLRNPVSWFFVHNGSHASMWSLSAGTWATVNALMLRPCHWHRPDLQKHQGQAIYMVLDGCRPAPRMGPHRGGSFFPECLRDELNQIRAAMEAFSKDGVIEGAEESTACGFALQKGDEFNARVRVTDSSNQKSEFLIDRWE